MRPRAAFAAFWAGAGPPLNRTCRARATQHRACAACLWRAATPPSACRARACSARSRRAQNLLSVFCPSAAARLLGQGPEPAPATPRAHARTARTDSDLDRATRLSVAATGGRAAASDSDLGLMRLHGSDPGRGPVNGPSDRPGRPEVSDQDSESEPPSWRLRRSSGTVADFELTPGPVGLITRRGPGATVPAWVT